MKAIYEDLLQLDRPFYEIHEKNYDPLKAITNFWNHYSLVTVREYLCALDLKCKTTETATENKIETLQQALFFADILRALIAYFLMHSSQFDTGQIKLATLEANMEEIQLTKKINDFFQSINQPTI